MITIINLIKSITTQLQFFPVIKTMKIDSLNNFQICSIVLLTIFPMLYVKSHDIYFITGSL